MLTAPTEITFISILASAAILLKSTLEYRCKMPNHRRVIYALVGLICSLQIAVWSTNLTLDYETSVEFIKGVSSAQTLLVLVLLWYIVFRENGGKT